METDHLGLGHSQQTEGIGVTQILFDHEGEFGNMVKGLDGIGGEIVLSHAVAVELHIVESVADDLLHPFQLHDFKMIAVDEVHGVEI